MASKTVEAGFEAQRVPVNATALIRGMLQGHGDKPQPGMGVLPPPTGFCLSPGSAHRVLQLAQEHNFHLV